MPPRISDDKRAAILADVRADKLSCRAIATKHGVSPSTVSAIAKDVPNSFERSQTKRATEAAVADNRAVRAVVSRRFLDKASEILDQMDKPYTVHAFGGKDNTFNSETLDRPPAGELRNLMVTAATAFDKHLAADRHDAEGEQGMAAVDQWLRSIVGS